MPLAAPAPARRARRVARLATLAAVVALAAACSGDGPSGPPPVDHLAFAAGTVPDVINVGDTITLAAGTFDAGNAPLTGRRVAYASSAPAVVGVDSASGRLTAQAVGAATITATAEGHSASYTLRVEPAVSAVSLYPHTLPLLTGTRAQLSALVAGLGGELLPGATVAYAVSNPAAVRLDPGGVIVALAAGTTTVTARSGGKTATTQITVTAPAAGLYRIDVQPAPGVDTRVASLVRQSAARWERVVVGDLPDVAVSLPANACDDNTPAYAGTVDDLVILLTVDSIDGPGKVAAYAGPCIVRDTDANLPILGIVRVDSADVATMLASGWAGDVLTHEFGHVLGIGTYNWSLRSLLRGAGTSDPRFTGAAAAAAAVNLGYREPDASVSVENSGGEGSADAHWRESNYGSELMTGFIQTASANPLSAVSAGSLRDIGYAVNDAGAEPTAAPQTTPRVYLRSVAGRATVAAAPGLRLDDTLLRPRWVAGADGGLRRMAP